MSDISNVIGEGTYGCVHKPSLKCKDNVPVSYENTVSKTISKRDASKEIMEYKNIVKADRDDDFYLGKPVLCDIDNISKNKSAIEKCKIADEVLNNLSGYKLIVMRDGGENLETYSKKVRNWPLTQENKRKCELFLLESLRLFKGLVVFKKHDLIHHDLKPQNIVFNEKDNRLNFIDFGIMQSKNKVKSTLLSGKEYDYALFHWSFPWETMFLLKRKFDRINIYTKKWLTSQFTEANGYYPHMQNFFYYSIDTSLPKLMYDFKINRVFNEYDMFITNETKDLVFAEFVDKCLDEIDLFGLGLSLMFWLHNAKKNLDPKHTASLESFYGRLLSIRISNRMTAEAALEWMEDFLTTSGLLQKYNKEIQDNMVVPKGQGPKPKPPVIVKERAKPFRDLIESDPGACIDGKEKNPKTGRCVNKCRSGQKRNSTFKCVKDLSVNCENGKERNPNTGRCVNKCSPGQKRNSTFKCVKEANKNCEAGKEKNPKTGRCINVCKSGYKRDKYFKCKKTIKKKEK
jgi:serine/threonine protein kinase